MKLVDNWKAIATRSHSMWANYLGLACLTVPEILFAVSEIETNPQALWISGVILIAYGAAGRTIDQGLSK